MIAERAADLVGYVGKLVADVERRPVRPSDAGESSFPSGRYAG
jgi:hypothetical protein